MNKYKVKREIEIIVDANNESDAKSRAAEHDTGDWSNAEVIEVEEALDDSIIIKK